MSVICPPPTASADPAPLVSVIMPVRNAEATLAASIASIRAQTLPHWELLLADDGSTDRSPNIAAAEGARDPRIRVLRLTGRSGAAGARNRALAAARGRFIAFLDADDRWHPEKLARQIAFMEDNGAALSFTAYRCLALDGRDLGRVAVPFRVNYAALLKRNVIGCLTVIYDSHRFGKVPMPETNVSHDFALWLALTRQGAIAFGLDEDLAFYRLSGASLSGNKLTTALDNWHVYRRIEGLRLPHTLWVFSHYVARSLAARLVRRRTRIR